MYCLQWLIPVLLMPKPLNPAFIYNHAMFIVLYLTGFFLVRKPCTICSLVFLAAVFLICYNCVGNCILWHCTEEECQGADCDIAWRQNNRHKSPWKDENEDRFESAACQLIWLSQSGWLWNGCSTENVKWKGYECQRQYMLYFTTFSNPSTCDCHRLPSLNGWLMWTYIINTVQTILHWLSTSSELINYWKYLTCIYNFDKNTAGEQEEKTLIILKSVTSGPWYKCQLVNYTHSFSIAVYSSSLVSSITVLSLRPESVLLPVTCQKTGWVWQSVIHWSLMNTWNERLVVQIFSSSQCSLLSKDWQWAEWHKLVWLYDYEYDCMSHHDCEMCVARNFLYYIYYYNTDYWYINLI